MKNETTATKPTTTKTMKTKMSFFSKRRRNHYIKIIIVILTALIFISFVVIVTINSNNESTTAKLFYSNPSSRQHSKTVPSLPSQNNNNALDTQTFSKHLMPLLSSKLSLKRPLHTLSHYASQFKNWRDKHIPPSMISTTMLSSKIKTPEFLRVIFESLQRFHHDILRLCQNYYYSYGSHKSSSTSSTTGGMKKSKVSSSSSSSTFQNNVMEKIYIGSRGGNNKEIDKDISSSSITLGTAKRNWGRMGQSCILSHNDEGENKSEENAKERNLAFKSSSITTATTMSKEVISGNERSEKNEMVQRSSCSNPHLEYDDGACVNTNLQSSTVVVADDGGSAGNSKNPFAVAPCEHKDKCFTTTLASETSDDKRGNSKALEKGLNKNNNDDDKPFPGMILQVVPPGYYSALKNDVDDSTAVEIPHDKAMQSLSSSSSRKVRLCANFNDIHITKNDDDQDKGLVQYVNEYVLIEQIHQELGLVDFYKADFAYTPHHHRKYEKMGDRAFAGGSHGEVWRARRRCPPPSSAEDGNSSSSSSDSLLGPCDEKQELIMKRLKNGYDILEAGLREVHFGDRLLREVADTSDLFTIYVDHFFRETTANKDDSDDDSELKDDEAGKGGGNVELWIVFENAGPSLRSYLYTPVDTGGFVMYEHSPFWRKLRKSAFDNSRKGASSTSVSVMDHKTDGGAPPKHTGAKPKVHQQRQKESSNTKKKTLSEGGELMKEVLRQILTSAANLHALDIIHRDIKPSNIMCKVKQIEESKSNVPGFANNNGTPDMEVESVRCVLGDFSSGYDEFTSQNMYAKGPSAAEQTDEYAPPEVLFGSTWIPFDATRPQSYDSWSIGVVALEMLLGTPNVFSVDQRTTTILSNKMKKEGASPQDIQHALYLAALSQFCIYVPTVDADKSWPLRAGDPLHGSAIVKPTCTMKDFHNALRARDPLGTGFDSSSDSLLELIWGLLAWDTKKRLTPQEALAHRYFQPNAGSEETVRTPWTSSILSSFSSLLSSGDHNALESQMLDPRMDFNSSVPDISEFVCPKCGKPFQDYNSCHKHANSRRHAKFCTFDRSTLPKCLNAHSMLPAHPTSGYCDIQGRRRVIEDFHTIHLDPMHQFYGVFDGHNGNLASKYAASSLYGRLVKRLAQLDSDVQKDQHWKGKVAEKMAATFEDLHEGILRAASLSPGGVMKDSGTTATALFVTEEAVIVANVGDSRAILSQGASYDAAGSTKRVGGQGEVTALQLTVDHIASDKNEQRRIKDLGGFVSSGGGIDRVNGTLAVSRSLGDANLSQFLSRHPHVVAMSRKEVKEQCGQQSIDRKKEHGGENNADEVSTTKMPCFIVLASDGLWDVMSNQEAVDMVVQVIRKYDPEHGISWEDGGAFQEAAQLLTEEAYVRGSTDNIGVCVVAIV